MGTIAEKAKRSWRTALLGICLAAAASSFAEEITLAPIEIAPPMGRMTQAATLSADTELWWFENDKKILEIFRNVKSATLVQKAKASTYTFQTLPESLRAQMDVSYKGRLGKGLIMAVSESMRQEFSKEMLSKVYDDLLRRNVSPFWYRYPSRDAFERELIQRGVQGEARKILMSELYQLPSRPGQYYFFVTKKTMSALPEVWQQDALRILRRQRQSVSATLKISTHDDLGEVAKKYAGDRDYRPIERYLRSQLEASHTREVAIPFEKILNPFIRDHLNQFADRDGPNCRNCALSTNQNRGEAKERYQSSSTTERKLFKEYRFVQPGEDLRTGDVIAYVDDKDEIIHAINYIGDARFEGNPDRIRTLVFTKNGFSGASPYMFSLRDEVDNLYKPWGAKRLLAFRKAANPGDVISPTGVLPPGARRPYYEELSASQAQAQRRPRGPAQCFFSEMTRFFSKFKR